MFGAGIEFGKATNALFTVVLVMWAVLLIGLPIAGLVIATLGLLGFWK